MKKNQMSKIVNTCTVILLFLAISIIFPVSICHASNHHKNGLKHILLVYTSSDYGEIAHCGCRHPAGGLPWRAGAIKQLRKQGIPILLVDAGDIFIRQSYRTGPYSLAIVKAMNKMGYNAICLGDEGLRTGSTLLHILKAARFKIVLSNITIPKLSKIKNITPYAIEDIDGIKIGIISLIDPQLVTGQFIKTAFPKIHTRAMIPAAKKYIKLLHKKTEIIVLLAHMSLRTLEKLLKQVKGINIAVVGHFPNAYNGVININGCLIVQSGRAGRQLGVLSLTINKKGIITSYHNKLITLDSSVPSDKQVQNIVKQAHRGVMLYWRNKFQKVNTKRGQ